MPTSVTSPSTGATTALRLCAEGGSECGAELNRRSIHFSQKCRKNVDAAPRRYSRGRWRVADGASPKRDWYSPAKRPKCQKPYRVAISVTVVAVRSTIAQGSPCEMHPAQQQISLGADPKLLLAAHLQCPARHTDRLGELRDVKRLIGSFLHRPAKPAHDRRVAPQRRSVLASLSQG